jgi:hypothetical protein
MIYYLLSSIFLLAFAIETIVTGSVFMHRDHLIKFMTPAMKYWALLSMVMISASNLLGWLWLKHNHETNGIIDRGNVIQALFAISIMSLFIWVLKFHKSRFSNSYNA